LSSYLLANLSFVWFNVHTFGIPPANPKIGIKALV
jgi:hypothetical protein